MNAAACSTPSRGGSADVLVLDRQRRRRSRRARARRGTRDQKSGPWTLPDRPEDPRSIGRVVEGPLVEHAGQRDLVGDQLGVLEVDVIDGRPERLDDGERVHLLPEQVRRVDVGPDDRADRVTHPQQRGHVVDEVQRVQLEGEPVHAVSSGEGARSCQSSMAAAHCRSSSAIESAGHGYQVKLTASTPGHRPGLPDIVTIFRMPSSPARRIVVADELRRAGRRATGWRGHAEQLSAAMRRPRLGERLCERGRSARVGEQLRRCAGGAPRTARRWRSRSPSHRSARRGRARLRSTGP